MVVRIDGLNGAHLEDGLHHNVSRHRLADEPGIPSVGSAVEEFHRWRFSTESKSAHCVHDEVDPEHHQGVQRGVLPRECTDEHN